MWRSFYILSNRAIPKIIQLEISFWEWWLHITSMRLLGFKPIIFDAIMGNAFLTNQYILGMQFVQGMYQGCRVSA